MSEIGVVHLARAANGLEPLERFLESYGRYPGGAAHELVAVLKGFSDDALLAECRKRLKRFPHRELRVPDTGFDIDTYAASARALSHRYLVFLNSFSVLQDREWLLKLYRHASREGVGIVGASGSCQSHFTIFSHEWRGWWHKPLMKRLGKIVAASRRDWHKAVSNLFHTYTRLPARWARLRWDFPPFPNHHVRTNAFMVAGAVCQRLRFRPNRSKMDAYRSESGREGLTRQIFGMGLRALVAGRDGRGYEKEDWPASATFWQGHQENLLVADNQTRLYSDGDFSTKMRLSQFAWGEQARPKP